MHSWLKNYEKIRANTWIKFCVVPWIPCEPIARRLCETLRLCVRNIAHGKHRNTQNCAAQIFRQKNIFCLTQNSRNTQNRLHVFTRIYTEKFSRKGAKGAERYVLLFLCQKSCTQKSRKYTETLLSMLFRESLRLLRETTTRRPRRLCEALRLCVRNIAHGKHRNTQNCAAQIFRQKNRRTYFVFTLTE